MTDGPRSPHPRFFEPATVLLGTLMAVLGAVIGLELLTRVGITPNSSIIAAVVAIALSRVPLAFTRRFMDVGRQNLMQTVISGATFGGANALLLPLGVVWLLGRPDLVPAMLVGALLGLLVDAVMLYRLFDSSVYPATGLWPAGVATAEVIIAGDRGGRRARLLGVGAAAGSAGQLAGIPMDVFGVCWIGNIWALTAFAVGLLIRGVFAPGAGMDIAELYVPHGVMIGAGVVALVQIVWLIAARGSRGRSESLASATPAAPGSGSVTAEPRPHGPRERQGPTAPRSLGPTLVGGYGAFMIAAVVLAALGGIATQMSFGMLVTFVLFAAAAALVSELIVGISAMHAGWFPAFATALIFLVLGMLMGFPDVPLALLVGFTAATGPAFADMAYDFKAGWILRGSGTDPAFERDGRRQQLIAECFGFAVAAAFVILTHQYYFGADLFPPVDRVYVATIQAGADATVGRMLLLWALPGALIQAIGGRRRQLGILLATGLLILNPAAGWAAAVALSIRFVLHRRYGQAINDRLYVLAGGLIAGSAVTSFGTATASRWAR
jgi:uncharacterized oligopeptide transporter (OPT) family protein